jgi:ribosomal silencing factor RsfS
MAVAIVTANNAREARAIAEENVLFYANQTSEAVNEEEADADDWNEVSQLASVSDHFYVG